MTYPDHPYTTDPAIREARILETVDRETEASLRAERFDEGDEFPDLRLCPRPDCGRSRTLHGPSVDGSPEYHARCPVHGIMPIGWRPGMAP